MALQTSGAISLTDIQTEFGGNNPISLDEYYGAASGIPSSGAISMNQFYGKSSAIVFDGPLTLQSNDLTQYYSLISPGWIGYFNNYMNNFLNSNGTTPFPSYPYGNQLGGVPDLPNTHTPTGHKVRQIGKNQSYPDKGQSTANFKFTLSGHLPNNNTAFTFLRINKNQANDTTFYRSSAGTPYHSYAQTKNITNTELMPLTQVQDLNDPITTWNWQFLGPTDSGVFLNAYVNGLGWSANGQTSNVEIQ